MLDNKRRISVLIKASTENIRPDSFSSRLAGVMRERKLNQNEIAEAAGVTQPAVSAWLKGPSLPQKRENWSRLAAFLNVTEDWLREGGERENISSNISTDSSRLHDAEAMKTGERHNPFEHLQTPTLQMNLADLSAKLPNVSEHERKHLLGNIRDILDELEQRELLRKAVDQVKEPTVVYGRTSSKKSVSDRVMKEVGKSIPKAGSK